MAGPPADVDNVDVLFLCTGNQSRSPVAEALLRDRLDRLGVAANVRSAGFLESGEPAAFGLTELLVRRKGLELGGHRSQSLTPDLVMSADVVLGMAREHVREAVDWVPEAWPRSFTLKELVRRGESIGARLPGESPRAWLARAHAGRAPSALASWSRRFDIKDPKRSNVAGARMVDDLEDLIDRLVALMWPRHAPSST